MSVIVGEILGEKNKVKRRYVLKDYSQQPKCEYISQSGVKCKAIVKSGTTRCRWHQINPPNPIPVPQSHDSNIPVPQISDGLNFEIDLLRKYLKRLTKASPSKISIEDMKLQISLVEQIRKLVFSLSNNKYEEKVYGTTIKIINTIVNKIVGIINKHVTDNLLKEIISSELMSLSIDESESGNINSLLKSINPKRKR